jgi:hypothetical protein
MRDHPDHHDAELLLRLYDLRREEKLRQARDWLIREFQADSMDDFYRRFPVGSRENDFFRMAVSYWDMAASIANHGLIKEEFFFESTEEFWTVWEKIKHLAPEGRAMFSNPYIWNNLEVLAQKYEKWMDARAPGAMALFRERVQQLPARK